MSKARKKKSTKKNKQKLKQAKKNDTIFSNPNQPIFQKGFSQVV